MVVKVYVSGISGNKEVKKRQQRVFMILESKNIPYNVVDIAEPGKEEDREFMQNNSKSLGKTISDVTPRHPLPPQIFNDETYCGDYDEFDLANEIDKLEHFLKVAVPESAENNSNDVQNETRSNANAEENESNNLESTVEKIETNGIASSREPSVESEKKTNGIEPATEEVEEVKAEEPEPEVEAEQPAEADDAEEAPEEENHKTPSEDLIESERDASE